MLVIVAVLIVAALAAVAVVLLSAPGPSGIQLASVQVAATPKVTLNQTETVTATATAVDTDGKDQTANVTWAWSASPASAVNLTQILANRVSVRGIEAAAVTVTAQATLGTFQKSGSASLRVESIQVQVLPQGPLAAVGEAFSLDIKIVKPPSGVIYTGYDGTVHFTSSDPAAILPPDGPVLQGVRTFTIRFGTSGPQTITVTDTVAPTLTGSAPARADRRPVASFTNQSSPSDRRVVTFTSTSTDPDGDQLTSFAWEFGDAQTQTVTTVSADHTYSVAGTVAVNLTVFDQHGLPSAKASRNYFISEPPIAFFFSNGTASVPPDIRVYVDARGSSGTSLTYNWTWGDGKQSESASPTTFHDYGPAYAEQSVDITLKVTDTYSVFDTHVEMVTVTIVARPPVARFEVTAEDDITLSVSVDAVTSTDPNGNIATLRWEWGDGFVTTVNWPPKITTASWTYASEGDYTITLVVTDTTALFDSTSKIVSLFRPALPPIAAFSVVKTGFHVDVDASATTDPNGLADIVAYNWTWGDGVQEEHAAPTATAGHTYATNPAIYTITLRVRDTTGRIGSAVHKVSVAATSFDYTFWDFFNVPYADYWDFRGDKYGDLPLGVTCFNRTAALVYDKCAGEAIGPIPVSQRTWYTAPPYTDWYPSPGSIRPGHASNNPFIYAPYRFRVIAANAPNYNVSEPVFFPVLNYGVQANPTSYLTFDWRFGFLTRPEKDALETGCGVFGFNDGFDDSSRVTLTMDLRTSGRLFGADISSPANARSWWQTNADTDCTTTSSIEAAWGEWYLDNGGTQQTTGKYDVANSCEWYYIDFMTQVNATVDNDGTTHVSLWNVGYCQEILLSRWFYWGNTSYIANWADSTKARGWWGMELAWFEDMVFSGTLTTTDMDFSLSSVMQYHFQQEADPGSDGSLNKVNDFPTWSWRPFLTDYTNDWNPSKHFISELDRYPTQTYLHSTPGSPQYNLNRSYDYAPISWGPKAGEEWHFFFPKGNVIFYDPRTASGANPTKPFTIDPTVKQYIKITSPLVYQSRRPATFGEFDSANMTWDVYGPLPATPSGSPGNYPLDYTVQPKIVFRNAVAAPAVAGSAAEASPSRGVGWNLPPTSEAASGFTGPEWQATVSSAYLRRKSE